MPIMPLSASKSLKFVLMFGFSWFIDGLKYLLYDGLKRLCGSAECGGRCWNNL